MKLYIYVSTDKVKSFTQEVFMVNEKNEIVIKLIPRDLLFGSLAESIVTLYGEGKYVQLNNNPIAYLVDKKTITIDDIDNIINIINAKNKTNFSYEIKKRVFNLEEFIKSL